MTSVISKTRKSPEYVYKSKPKGYEFIDVASDYEQAKRRQRIVPEHYEARIVATPKYKKWFPYHIAAKKRIKQRYIFRGVMKNG